jgi:hypothetical protein
VTVEESLATSPGSTSTGCPSPRGCVANNSALNVSGPIWATARTGSVRWSSPGAMTLQSGRVIGLITGASSAGEHAALGAA